MLVFRNKKPVRKVNYCPAHCIIENCQLRVEDVRTATIACWRKAALRDCAHIEFLCRVLGIETLCAGDML